MIQTHLFTKALCSVLIFLSAYGFAQQTAGKAFMVYNQMFVIDIGKSENTVRKEIIASIDMLRHLSAGSLIYFTEDGMVMQKNVDDLWEVKSPGSGDSTQEVSVFKASEKQVKTLKMKNFSTKVTEILGTGNRSYIVAVPVSQSPQEKTANPEKGMMFFDEKTEQITIYTGTEWWMWKMGKG